MELSQDIVQVAQILLILAFLGLTSLLFVVTMLNRSAVRNVLMIFPRGKLLGYPIAPAIFISAVLALAVAAVVQEHANDAVLYCGYALGGVLWLVSQHVGKATYVTRNGFVRWLGGSHNRIAWSQVQDFFEVDMNRHRIFVLLYFDGCGVRKRYEIRVPQKKVEEFRLVLERQIYWSEPMSSASVIDFKALEGE